jgi:hypothetical protein
MVIYREKAGEKILKKVPKDDIWVLYNKPENQWKNFQSPGVT